MTYENEITKPNTESTVSCEKGTSSPQFSLGKIYLTNGATEALEASNQNGAEFLKRHHQGDWGDLCESDKEENDLSVKEGFRILSAYRMKTDERLWIITEADRSSTTLLLPEEY